MLLNDSRQKLSCYSVPWILMSAMLQLWSHSRTLKAPSVTITFRSMTSLSAGDIRAADRKHNNMTNSSQSDRFQLMNFRENVQTFRPLLQWFVYTTLRLGLIFGSLYVCLSASVFVYFVLTGLGRHCLVLCLWFDLSLCGRHAARRQGC